MGEGFKMAYISFLEAIQNQDFETLREIVETKLYMEIKDQIFEPLSLYSASLRVENAERGIFEVDPVSYSFFAGAHIEKERNEREQRSRVDALIQEQTNLGLEIYASKDIFTYNHCPLNFQIEVLFKTNTKLNLILDNIQLFTKEEIFDQEFHLLQFQGHIGDFLYDADSMIELRHEFEKQKHLFMLGMMINVKEWKITDIDGFLKHKIQE